MLIFCKEQLLCLACYLCSPCLACSRQGVQLSVSLKGTKACSSTCSSTKLAASAMLRGHELPTDTAASVSERLTTLMALDTPRHAVRAGCMSEAPHLQLPDAGCMRPLLLLLLLLSCLQTCL